MKQEEKKIFDLLEDGKWEEAVPLAMAYYGIRVVDTQVEVPAYSALHQLKLDNICILYDEMSKYFHFRCIHDYANAFYIELSRMVKYLPLKWHYYTRYIFCAHYLDMPWKEYFRIHAAYNKLFKDIWQFQHDKELHRKHEKLRIGYLSTDFRRHVVLLFIWELISKYNREDFQVYCFANGKEDDIAEEVQKRVDCWVDISGMKAPDAAKAIYSHEIDILFELGGHAHDNLPILAYKPAPVQICGIGYWATTGLRTVDYFLTDKYLMAGGSVKYFVEKPLVMSHSHLCFTPLNDMPQEVKGAPCLEKGYITFGSLNDPLKINERVLAAWSDILAKVPGSRMLIKGRTLDTDPGVEYMQQRLVAAGIDPARIDLEPFTLPYLEAYWKIDIALDTFPYPGGGTTCDALCMGCPVITLGDGTMGGDFGISLLNNVGLPELCAYSQEEYIQKAVELAGDTDRLEYLHRNLKGMFMDSPICDGAGYMRELEAHYRRIWQEYLGDGNVHATKAAPLPVASQEVHAVENVLPYYDELIADLKPIMTKRILVCSAGDMLPQKVRQKYSWAVVERLQDVGRDRLLLDRDVSEIEHFDWILLDRNMINIADDAKFIQLMGLHLSLHGQLRCIAMSSRELEELHAVIYGNGFRIVYHQNLGHISGGSDEAYIYYAQNFTAVQTWLMQYYTEDIRREIGFLLSRIDFDIDATESAARLGKICRKHEIGAKYLRTFIESATVNKEKVMSLLECR